MANPIDKKRVNNRAENSNQPLLRRKRAGAVASKKRPYSFQRLHDSWADVAGKCIDRATSLDHG